MSRLHKSQSVFSKSPVQGRALRASAKNNIAKDGEHVLEHEGITPRIGFARHDTQFIAEFRFRSRCGRYQSCTPPLTINARCMSELANELVWIAAEQLAHKFAGHWEGMQSEAEDEVESDAGEDNES